MPAETPAAGSFSGSSSLTFSQQSSSPLVDSGMRTSISDTDRYSYIFDLLSNIIQLLDRIEEYHYCSGAILRS